MDISVEKAKLFTFDLFHLSRHERKIYRELF